MINQKTPIRIDTEPVSIYPAFVDYDFKNNRPRGGSCRIDFFSYGRLSGIIDDVEAMSFVFIRKSNTFFENGMFLADFSIIDEDPSAFLSTVADLGLTKIYLEDSDEYPLEKAKDALSGVEILPIRFY